MPTCPAGLTTEATAEFERIAAVLYDAGTSQELDRYAIAVCAAAWATWTKAQAQIAATAEVVKSGAGAAVVNPWCTVAAAAFKTMATLIPELGLSPTARQRMKPKKKQPQTTSKWEGLLA
jgi:P27 family predicted phage terminase small subunit